MWSLRQMSQENVKFETDESRKCEVWDRWVKKMWGLRYLSKENVKFETDESRKCEVWDK
jgi:hypothetical protein